MELSGSQWVHRYPTSRSIDDLVSPFKNQVKLFHDALIAAHAAVVISATLRPTERAFLMHTSFDIAAGTLAPQHAGTLPGLEIQWVHPTQAESIAAAKAMVAGYGIAFRPAFPSKHSEGTAIDMTITWTGTLNLKQANGLVIPITATPGNNSNSKLQQVGKTYGVIKLVSDPPHWSNNGH
jgi:D-alanyl-D-alanine dipeptidase